MSSYVLIDFEAGWAGVEFDPRATMIGVKGAVDERTFGAVVDERPYTAEIAAPDTLFASVGLPVYKARVTQPPSPVAVVREHVHPIAVVDESRYGAVVTIPAKPIAKVDEWPSS